ncbi:MAG TPA: ATP-binding protein [Phycisphaerales bacterium]|nr:ATP-binding protein [Phycisphaerales bacterium]
MIAPAERMQAADVIASRTDELFRQHLHALHVRTDRLFAWLLATQCAAGFLGAFLLTPRTWSGADSSVHPHVWGVLLMGSIITIVPILLTRLAPGAALTRHVIAASQVSWSALFIHITGGRIETHFHVFGSLAFLALYRDFRVTLTATAVVAIDHLVRGLWFPQSVFGIVDASQWRWLEHAAWVLFEDAILIPSCLRGLKDMRSMSERQAQLEASNAATEEVVRERTQELKKAYEDLRQASAEREGLYGRLVSASRRAGMAEVATGVLHNVGNVLNSVNVAAHLMAQRLRESEIQNLVRVSEILQQHQADLGQFLEKDQRGRHVPTFIIEAAQCLARERDELEGELRSIMQGVEHVKHVVTLQQEHAKSPSMIDAARPREVVDAALELVRESMIRHGIEVVRSIETDATFALDKHQVIQILVNLITNARQAMNTSAVKRITIHVSLQGGDGKEEVRFSVLDTGAGIAPEHLTRVFQHGFTTKADGHGFGLHSAATAAQAMGGSLSANSEGPGRGAQFVLTLPAVRTHGGPAASGTNVCIAS